MILLLMFVSDIFTLSMSLANGDDQIATPIWKRSVDQRVIAHRDEHRAYLGENGFFDDT
jgi:hypothetical protein